MSIFVKGNWKVRRAQESDIAALEQLIALSAHGLGASYYSAAKLDAALGTVFGVDRQLIRDGTYFVAETENELLGCGGWGKTKNPFCSDRQAGPEGSEPNT